MLRRVLVVVPLVMAVLGFTVVLGGIIVSSNQSVGPVGVAIGNWSLALDADGLEVVHREHGDLVPPSTKFSITLNPFAVGLALVVPGAVCGAVAEARRRQRARRGFPMMNPKHGEE